jgi:tRNA pseudouridine32 synthase/23S rRNA pseudouridine746 synthase
LELAVLFKNDYFVVIDKPAGILSVPSRLGSRETRLVAGLLLESQLGSRVWPTHRLDEGVSGALMFALNPEAHRAANAWFEAGKVFKTYEAISVQDAGLKVGESFSWECSLMRGKKRAYINDKIGKTSITEGHIEAQVGPYFKWILHPKTGRSHQLRFELFRHGAPIVGDELYGGQAWTVPGIGLRSLELNLEAIPQNMRLDLPNVIAAPRMNWC